MTTPQELADENKLLRAAVATMLPMIEEAFYDNSSAGMIPGSGYNHRVYHKISAVWGWRSDDKFKAFADPLRAIIKATT